MVQGGGLLRSQTLISGLVYTLRNTLRAVTSSIERTFRNIRKFQEFFFLTRSFFFFIKKSNGNFCNKLHNWYNNIQNLQISSSE